MEDWQMNVILTNHKHLIKCTLCDTQLLDRLQQHGILSEEDVDSLGTTVRSQGNLAASSLLYETVETRYGGYETLLWALHESRQDPPYLILRQGYEGELARTNGGLTTEQLSDLVSQALQQRGLVLTSFANGNNNASHVNENSQESIPQQSSSHHSSINPTPARNATGSADEENIIKFETTVENILGDGSGGTRVFRGTFRGRTVAVKQLSNFKSTSIREAETEIDMLLKLDEHKNVIRYYGKNEDRGYILLALELAQGTLNDWLKNREFIAPAVISEKDILKQTTEGLRYLHSNNVIHRDLKPSNILLKVLSPDEVMVKISDFGVSRFIEEGRKSKTITSVIGSEGWMAPEVLAAASDKKSNPKEAKPHHKMTNKVDIFSLGCIFHFVLTNGKHPFGDDEQEGHIKRNEVSLSLDNFEIGCNVNLISSMITNNPLIRPDCSTVLKDSIFWPKEKMLQFLIDVSDFVEDVITIMYKKQRNENDLDKMKTPQYAEKVECINKLEISYDEIWKGYAKGWFHHTCCVVRPYLEKDRYKMFYQSVLNLLRIIRNLKSHNGRLEEGLRKALGSIPDGYVEYWMTQKRFPLLVYHVRNSFQSMSTDEKLRSYYN